ncbi:hypothetical protein [Ferrovibrio xuzhouensis]|uniref:Exonuclease n=1 Tax=Ferrovibrio xuzhouensis TaxID=1576914 RepID=A0ABV7VJV0_9PROT
MREIFVSVDIETSGPVPAEYSLLSIGACAVTDIDNGFYCELKPTGLKNKKASMKVAKPTLDHLEKNGL